MSWLSSTMMKSNGVSPPVEACSATRVNTSELCDQLPSTAKPCAHALEDRPEDCALVLAEARFAAQPCHIAIGLPRVELPGVDDVVPLRFQESMAEAVRRSGLRGFEDQFSDGFGVRHVRWAEGVLVQLGGEAVDGVDDDPLRHFRFARSQSAEFYPQRAREGVAEGREQHSRIGIAPREVRGSVQRDNRLAGAGRAGDSSGGR